MTASKLRAIATAFLLGIATVYGGVMIISPPAVAAVRASVGKPLMQARSLAEKGDYKAAMAKVKQAEAVSGKTAEETKIIAQMKNYIAVKSGDTSTTAGAKAKFASDYNARRYKDVIADAEALKKHGAFDTAAKQVVAQAYYLSGDKRGCLNFIKREFGNNIGNDALELQVRCAYDVGDTATQIRALESLVARTGKPEYWSSLFKIVEHIQGIRDQDTLDIYRLKLLTGTISGADEYNLLAQLALQLRYPSEAVAVIEKGIAAKVLKGSRVNRLLALAKKRAAADAANTAKDLAAAKAAPKGDALIQIGEQEWGQGKYKAAVANIEAGLKKPVTDKNNAEISLGMAYLGAGQKANAQRAFARVKGPSKSNVVMIAHLWSLYARH